MLRFDDKIDTYSQSSNARGDYLTAFGRTQLDYNGCLPSDDDAADFYNIPSMRGVTQL